MTPRNPIIITVGKTGEGNSGISDTHIIVEKPDEIVDPAGSI